MTIFRFYTRALCRATRSLPPERLNTLRHIATIESVGSSTRIEGSALGDREVEALLRGIGVRRFTTRDEQEVAGYAEVVDLVVHSHRRFSSAHASADESQWARRFA